MEENRDWICPKKFILVFSKITMEILEIVTVQEIKERTTIQELATLCDEKPETVNKYIKIISAKIRTKIDQEIFKVGENYEIPSDLKMACISLIDSFYNRTIKAGNTGGKMQRTSYTEKIDDYSISETYSENNVFSFYGIPTDGDVLDILKKYMSNESRGLWNINLH